MNASRMLTISSLLIDEIQQTLIQERLESIISLLGQIASNQSASQSIESVSIERQNIRIVLGGSSYEQFPEEYRYIVREMNIERYFGLNLVNTIERIFTENDISTKNLRDKLIELRADLHILVQKLHSLIDNLEWFRTASEDLKVNECELAYGVNLRQEEYSIETIMNKWNSLKYCLDTCYLLSGSTPPQHMVKTLSSSMPTIILNITPEIAVIFGQVVVAVADAYKAYIQFREKVQGLKEEPIDDQIEELLDKKLENFMPNKQSEIAVSILTQHENMIQKSIEGEMENRVNFMAKTILEEIDNGAMYSLVVKTEFSVSDIKSEEGSAVAEALALSRQIGYTNSSGNSILSLPRSDEQLESENEAPRIEQADKPKARARRKPKA